MKSPEEIEWFLEDLFLGSQWSIILGYRRLSVKSRIRKEIKRNKRQERYISIRFQQNANRKLKDY